MLYLSLIQNNNKKSKLILSQIFRFNAVCCFLLRASGVQEEKNV